MNIIQIILHNTIFGSIHLMNQIWDLWAISDDFSDVITAYLRKMGLKAKIMFQSISYDVSFDFEKTFLS